MEPETDAGATSALSLPPVADATAAERLRPALQGLLRGAGPAVIGGAAVERIGTPMVQALLAFDRSLTRDGRRLILADASPALRAAFADLGLAQTLRHWAELG